MKSTSLRISHIAALRSLSLIFCFSDLGFSFSFTAFFPLLERLCDQSKMKNQYIVSFSDIKQNNLEYSSYSPESKQKWQDNPFRLCAFIPNGLKIMYYFDIFVFLTQPARFDPLSNPSHPMIFPPQIIMVKGKRETSPTSSFLFGSSFLWSYRLLFNCIFLFLP